MISYIGRHAALYDIFYQDKNYKNESEFIHKYFCHNGHGSALFEAACGTGNHAFEFEKLGYIVTAIDNSPDMIQEAERKILEKKSNVSFSLASMSELDTNKFHKYDYAVCLFDSLGYVLTNDNIKNTLCNIYSLLNPDGIFCCEVWHSAAMLKGYSPVRYKQWNIGDTELIRISETSLDTISSVAKIDFTILELHKNGSYTKIQETQNNRFFSVNEITYFLTEAGFTDISIFDSFTQDTLINDQTWNLLCFGHKKNTK